MLPHGVEVGWERYGEKRIGGRPNPEIVSDSLPSRSEEVRLAVVEAKGSDFNRRTPPGPDLVRPKTPRTGLRLAFVTNAPREKATGILRAIGPEDAFEAGILWRKWALGCLDPAPYRAAPESLGIAADGAPAFEGSRAAIAPVAGVFVVSEDSTDPKLTGLIEARQGAASTRRPRPRSRRRSRPA